MKLLSAIFLITAFLSCDSTPAQKEKHEASTIKTNQDVTPPATTAECNNEAKANPGSQDSILVQTCKLGAFKLISTGTPDYKGRYSYEYQLYKIVDGKDVAAKNSDIFNDKVAELEKEINAGIAKDLAESRQDKESAQCLEGFQPKNYNIDDVGISFTENNMTFNVDYGIGGACMAVGGTGISMSMDEVRKYLK